MRKLRYTRPHTRNLRRLGATATEYILILIAIVLPIALMLPLFTKMIKNYGHQLTSLLQLPFP